jgi:DNA-binding NarL/FixJ family response regulator
MSQRGVQLVIGRLLTDQLFRDRFVQQGRMCLARMRDNGIELSDAEIDALIEADPRVWAKLAAQLDTRLHVDGLLPDSAPGATRPLSARERRVLGGVFDGLTNKEIAAEVGVTEGAVKATLQRLFRKTTVRTRAQLVRAVVDGALEIGESTSV